MGAPLRKPRYAANDFQRPVALPMPVAHLVPYVRLPAIEPRKPVSLVAVFAAFLLTGTIFMLGVVAGTVFWFTYDARLSSEAPQAVSAVAARLEIPVLPPAPPAPEIESQTTSPADIVLRAKNPDETPPVTDTELLGEARAQTEKGHNDVALALYERVLLGEPQNSAALEGRAYALQHLNTDVMIPPVAASELQKEAAPVVADDAPAQIALAKSLAGQSKYGEAIIHLDRAVRMEPDNYTYRLDLAILYDRAGQKPQALMLYRQVLAMSDESDTPLTPSWLASIRQRVGYLEAVQAPEER